MSPDPPIVRLPPRVPAGGHEARPLLNVRAHVRAGEVTPSTRDHGRRVRDSRAWQRLRDTVRARDGGCTRRSEGGCHGSLEVHHVWPLEQGGTNELRNLVTLGRAHHEQAERDPAFSAGRSPIPRQGNFLVIKMETERGGFLETRPPIPR